MKTIYSGAICAVLCLAAATAQAADVTITINGQVVAKPCTISTTTANVSLGTLSTSTLQSAGSVSDWKAVALNLTNCPVGTSSVKATFTGTSDSTGTYFLNQGTAGKIAVQLADSSGNNVTNGGTLTSAVSDSTLSTTFNLEVRAITSSGSATQGSIQSVVNVTYTWQ
ncbi:type 1 fimbria minor subunit FimG [Tatumella terrea]|uniref:fimbrial protein n=1 Tax=Tatumella terrea TaxID=419007 RepID=UPI0031CE4D8D